MKNRIASKKGIRKLFITRTFLIVRATLLLTLFIALIVVSAMVEEFFNLYKLYKLKPRDFSKNYGVLSKNSCCTPVFSIQKTGVKVSLLTKKVTFPYTNPNSQLGVITILEFSGRLKSIRLVFILFFSSSIDLKSVFSAQATTSNLGILSPKLRIFLSLFIYKLKAFLKSK